IPDHRAQLGLDVEAEAVVDAVDGAVLGQQAVAALAVGVVGHQVERADALERIVVGGDLAQREVMLLEVGGHEALQRAGAVRTLADVVGRHHSVWTTWPLARGQTWPAGSFGSPHIGQVARPAFTSARVRSTKAVAWARVTAKRAEAGSAAGVAPSSSSSTCSLAM